jgi:Tol biopolymer transport system component
MRTPLVLALFATSVSALRAQPPSAQTPAWDVTQARGTTRDIDFSTSEGTWMSVDISPDGKLIAFISDRRGQNNLGVMNADGSNPRAVFTDLAVRAAEPAWTADGNFIVVRRSSVARRSREPGSCGSRTCLTACRSD